MDNPSNINVTARDIALPKRVILINKREYEKPVVIEINCMKLSVLVTAWTRLGLKGIQSSFNQVDES